MYESTYVCTLYILHSGIKMTTFACIDRHNASYTYCTYICSKWYLSPCFSVTGKTGQCVSTSTENISVTVGTHMHTYIHTCMYIGRREGEREGEREGV